MFAKRVYNVWVEVQRSLKLLLPPSSRYYIPSGQHVMNHQQLPDNPAAENTLRILPWVICCMWRWEAQSRTMIEIQISLSLSKDIQVYL